MFCFARKGPSRNYLLQIPGILWFSSWLPRGMTPQNTSASNTTIDVSNFAVCLSGNVPCYIPGRPYLFRYCPQRGGHLRIRALYLLEVKLFISCFARLGPSGNFPWHIPGKHYDFLLGPWREGHLRIRAPQISKLCFLIFVLAETAARSWDIYANPYPKHFLKTLSGAGKSQKGLRHAKTWTKHPTAQTFLKSPSETIEQPRGQ